MSTWRARRSSSRRWRRSACRPGSGRYAGALLAVLAVVWLALPVPPAAGAAPSLDEALQAVEAAYQRVTDLQAAFQQASLNRTLNRTVEARGTFYLKKPGKLRWEYDKPTAQEIVSDGQRLWVYTPELKQVNVAPAPEALAGPAGSFLQGLGQVREHFQARFLNPAQPTDAEGRVVLDLTPRTPRPLLARLILSVDPASWLARKAVVYDELGNTVTVQFEPPRVNAGLPDRLFTFTPPSGAVVVPAPGMKP